MRRHAVGVIGLVLLAVAAGLWIWPAESERVEQLQGFALRIGALLAIFWLALPELDRLPGWLLAAVLVGLALLSRWPKQMLLFTVLVVAALAVLRPRGGGNKSRRSEVGGRNRDDRADRQRNDAVAP